MRRPKPLDRLMDVFEILRSIDPTMHVSLAHVFVAVALRPGLTMDELGELVNLSQSSCSRNIMTLAKGTPSTRDGHRLVRTDYDPEDGRRMIILPTTRGRALARELASALELPEKSKPRT